MLSVGRPRLSCRDPRIEGAAGCRGLGMARPDAWALPAPPWNDPTVDWARAVEAASAGHAAPDEAGQAPRRGGSTWVSGTMPDRSGASPARARSRAAIGGSPGSGEGTSAAAQQDDGGCPHAPPAEQFREARVTGPASLTAPFGAAVKEIEKRAAATRSPVVMMSGAAAGTACARGAGRWSPCAWAPHGMSDAAIAAIAATSQSAMGRADVIDAETYHGPSGTDRGKESRERGALPYRGRGYPSRKPSGRASPPMAIRVENSKVCSSLRSQPRRGHSLQIARGGWAKV